MHEEEARGGGSIKDGLFSVPVPLYMKQFGRPTKAMVLCLDRHSNRAGVPKRMGIVDVISI